EPPARALATFFKSIPEPVRRGGDRAMFASGFTDAAALFVEAELFLEHANELARLFPCAVELDLEYASQGMARLAMCRALARFRRLRFYDTYLFEGRAAHLARSPYIAQLEELGLYGTNLYDEDLAPILASPRLRSLRSLDLGNPREDQNYTLAGLRPIAQSVF